MIAPGSGPDNAQLKRVTFVLNPGESLGIVGPSGAGKSTLARVLVGALEPQGGSIRLDGALLQNWNSADLGKEIGYLSQEVELLPGSVAQNISRLAASLDAKDVLEAAQKANVHEMILKLPNGYDTVLGPGGFSSSGGQRQRIALARAFYGNPKLMVLDEPNANLDEEGDAALARALAEAKKNGATLILITQRPQILNGVDKVLRLHAGTVDFFGTRQEFISKLSALRQKANEMKAAMQRSAAASNKSNNVAIQSEAGANK